MFNIARDPQDFPTAISCSLTPVQAFNKSPRFSSKYEHLTVEDPAVWRRHERDPPCMRETAPSPGSCLQRDRENRSQRPSPQREALAIVLAKCVSCFERYHDKRLVRHLSKYQTLMDDLRAVNEDIDRLYTVLKGESSCCDRRLEAAVGS